MISTRRAWRGFGVAIAAALLLALGPGIAARPDRPEGAPAPEPSSDAAPASAERWYQLLLEDVPAGWMMTRETRRGERLITETESRFEVARGGARVHLEMVSRFVEGDDGTPIEAWSRQLLGEVPIEVTFVFGESSLEVTTVQAGRARTKRKPLPEGDWLTPAHAQAALAAAVDSGTEAFEIVTADPLLGLTVVETEWKRVASDARVDVPAGTFAVDRFEQRTSVTPGLVTRVDLDSDAQMIASVLPFGGTSIKTVLADRAVALATSEAPELLVSTFVYPSRVIANPRALERAVFRLRRTDGASLRVPSTGAQTAREEGESTHVVVDLAAPSKAASETLDRAAFLGESSLLDHRADAVVALLESARRNVVPDDATSAEVAESLRRFVHGHLEEKDLDSLFASASEVARTRSGDCTEHGVLLAALLRGANIPSRVVVGLIYVDRFAGASDLFGYHLWTQAWVDDRWVDLDATLESPFDAAHIALATSALSDDRSALLDLAAIVPSIGQLAIEVVETE